MPTPTETYFEKLERTRVWRSIFRSGTGTSTLHNALAIQQNVFLHLFPTKVRKRMLSLGSTWYLGTLTLGTFLVLVVTGILLMLYYHPSVPQAYSDVKDLRFVVSSGSFLRNLHRWSAHAMVFLAFAHMFRVFYRGAYRAPREFNWVVGVVLLLVTLLLSYTGYLLPWDQLAYWAITVGTNIGSYAPLVGGKLRELLLGGHTVGEAALLRFYVLHVAVLPSLVILFTIVHFWRVRKDGGLSRPIWKLKPQKTEALVTIGAPAAVAPLQVTAASKDKTYGLMEVVTGKPIFETVTPEEEEDTVFSYPYAFVREAVALMATVTTIMAISLFFKAPLEEMANPAVTPNPAKAPWYFLGLQELVSHSALLGGVVVPALMVIALIAIPYIDRNPSRRPRDRKWAIWLFTFFVVANILLIIVGTFFRGPGWAWVPPWVHVVARPE